MPCLCVVVVQWRQQTDFKKFLLLLEFKKAGGLIPPAFLMSYIFFNLIPSRNLKLIQL